jgi:hypothetical protein
LADHRSESRRVPGKDTTRRSHRWPSMILTPTNYSTRSAPAATSTSSANASSGRCGHSSRPRRRNSHGLAVATLGPPGRTELDGDHEVDDVGERRSWFRRIPKLALGPPARRLTAGGRGPSPATSTAKGQFRGESPVDSALAGRPDTRRENLMRSQAFCRLATSQRLA